MTEDSLPFKVLQYCPFCGSDHFIPGNSHDKYLECGICGKRLYVNAASAVAGVIRDQEGRVLLTRRKFDPGKGMLDLPGGFVDPGETAEDALVREIKEELNLDICSLEYICSSPNKYLYKGLVYFTLDLGFECSVVDFSTMMAADDVDSCLFLFPMEIKINEVSFPSIRNIVQIALKI